jgi:short-subunit dehydrogenase
LSVDLAVEADVEAVENFIRLSWKTVDAIVHNAEFSQQTFADLTN